MTALHSEADIKLNLGKRSANDPKRTFQTAQMCPDHVTHQAIRQFPTIVSRYNYKASSAYRQGWREAS